MEKVTPLQPLLDVEGIRKNFGGLAAIDDLSFDVRPRCIKSVIGPNGAGKTTLFNLITGVEPLDVGTIWLKGTPLKGLKPHQRVQLGIGRTFQAVEIWDNMSVVENVMIGRHPRTRSGIVSALFFSPGSRREEAAILEESLDRLALVGLTDKARESASNLSFSEMKLLEIARALATEPELLLLDEPAAGLNLAEVNRVMAIVRKIRDTGVTVLLVEHNMRLVMTVSDEVLVLNHGKRIAEGVPADVQKDTRVVETYLGKELVVARR